MCEFRVGNIEEKNQLFKKTFLTKLSSYQASQRQVGITAMLFVSIPLYRQTFKRPLKIFSYSSEVNYATFY